MKILWFSILTLCSCQSVNSNIQGEINYLDDRSYLVETSEEFNSDSTYDLIMAFHGANGTGYGMRSLAHFETLSDNYIVVYPDAKVENWEEGCMCNKPYRLGIDDIGFVDALLDTIMIHYKINSKRVFAVGFSQGGLFAHNVACKLSNRFKAIVTVASPMSLPLSQNCHPVNTVSVMMIHGVSDSILPYEGESSGSFSLISSPAAIRFWAAHNNALTEPVISYLDNNQQIKIEDFSVTSTTKIKLISILNAGHQWSFSGFNTSTLILDFFDNLQD